MGSNPKLNGMSSSGVTSNSQQVNTSILPCLLGDMNSMFRPWNSISPPNSSSPLLHLMMSSDRCGSAATNTNTSSSSSIISSSFSSSSSPDETSSSSAVDRMSNMVKGSSSSSNGTSPSSDGDDHHGCHSNSKSPPGTGSGVGADSSLREIGNSMCSKHREEVAVYCRTCDVACCKECLIFDHQKGRHELESIQEVVDQIMRMLDEGRHKSNDLASNNKNLEMGMTRLQMNYSKAQGEINEAHLFFQNLLEECKMEASKELEHQYSDRLVGMTVLNNKIQDSIEKLSHVELIKDRMRSLSSPGEVICFKQIMDSRVRNILNLDMDVLKPNICSDLEFVVNYQSIRNSVRNSFGYIRSNGGGESVATKQPPISRPNGLGSVYGHVNGYDGLLSKSRGFGSNCTLTNGSSESPNANSNRSLLGPSNPVESVTNGMEKWSLGTPSPDSGLFGSNGSNILDHMGLTFNDPLMELPKNLLNNAQIMPIKSQIKRQKMIYHCKFGEFGVMEGQFTEPSGVAVNAQNDIIVADTNNHRIQIFDREGRFKFQFGECGKRDGQLLYPNRVAVVKSSGDIIVTERSPTHQIQIYNQYGQFVRKFGANILQHPRGVTVDNKGRIIVVECKVMRVLIFDQMGNVLTKFGCSKHLEFPNGVVVNDKQEIFISDNRAHCVKVFNYDGLFLRQIGGEGLTNYPIGVCINENGDILVADNHNNFNITIFTQKDELISALESKVKHAQCFDVALMDDNSVVLASKDYRIYIYRYLQLQNLVGQVATNGLI